ncbi:MAG: hypothetical protein JO257_36850 [Deltaproteobacteria bacterium]|nr:hypothetical protein [Deltaproteobacteria bacterium]
MKRLGILVVAACATTPAPAPRGGPRGLRASEHLEIAQQHDEQAREQVTIPASFDTRDGNGIVWMRAWDPSAEHERTANAHRSEAAAMHADYEEACGTRPIEEVSVSPLRRYATGGWPTSAGIIMYLSPAAGAPDKLLADLKCHRAWMMLAPSGMDDCPLDLPGIVLDARGDHDGVTVSIVVRDPKLVDELHRRAAHELEASEQLQRAPH